jgi:two-component system chemotaxis sensor kinase CheA
MSLAAKVREQLINSFRVELAEHVQTMNDGLLALEQGTVDDDLRQSTLEEVFRAAHSLKGAARAMGVTMVEQLAHALESVLDDIQQDTIKLTTDLFTACYQAIDAIQAVQTSYEAGDITPPTQTLQALSELEQIRSRFKDAEDIETGAVTERSRDVDTRNTASSKATPPDESATAVTREEVTHTNTKEEGPSSSDEHLQAQRNTTSNAVPTNSSGDETIRVSVSKLDVLMAQLSELLITKIRAEQRLSQVNQLREFMTQWQREWLAARSAYSRLARQDANGAFGHRRLVPIEGSPPIEETNDEGRTKLQESPELTVGAQPPTSGPDGKTKKDISNLIYYVGTSQDRLREVNTLINDLAQEYANDTMHMSVVIDELEQEIKRARMLPLTTITGTFGRMVRDLAHESNKEAVLQIVGGDTELDKRVLEQIKDPLMHLLRNAVDHGIEPPEQRKAASKPPTGTISLTAEQLGKDVIICVSDDGQGLDLEAIRQAAARRGVVDAQALSEEDLKEAIFNVGVSTSPIITDISGRGIGMDVVRRNVEKLHGRIDVDSRPNEGATFTLTLPLTLTSSRGLLIQIANELFAIPHSAIERIMYVKSEQIFPLEGRDTILHKGRPLTLVRLNDVLGLPRMDGAAALPFTMDGQQNRVPVVILAAAERRMAFAVDELAGEQEVVIKGLGKQLSRVGGITGATVMGSGEVVLILNVADLIKLGLKSEGRSVLANLTESTPIRRTPIQRHILIVDDSITTRTLEKNILEAAGYTVQLATDGQEALNAITAGGVPDLIVSDIVMPRLDGFGLTQHLKEDPRTANVPVILVTSLDSSDDKTRGIEVGADAYITKSSFDQNNLLETIEQLI